MCAFDKQSEEVSPERDEAKARAPDYGRESKALGQIVTTFYSFKGGVGRSQALCAVGHLLSQRRRRVLLVDVDLEAPGLSLALLEPDVLRSKLGFLEIAADLSREVLNAATGELPLPDSIVRETAGRISENLFELPLPQEAEEPEVLRRIRKDFPQVPLPERNGAICLLTCGRIYDDYAGGTARLRLPELLGYQFKGKRAEKAKPLIEAAGFKPDEPHPENLLQVLVRVLHDAFLQCELPVPAGDDQGESTGKKTPEYVLVDSRAGLADVGGLCVRGLADHLVILSGLNKQNLAGTRMVRERLEEDGTLRERPTIVLSPVPESEIGLLDKRILEAQRILGLDSSPLLLHYHPRLALVEECFIERVHRHTQLGKDYQELCLRIQSAHGDSPTEHLRGGLAVVGPDLDIQKARQAVDHLIEAAVLSPDGAAATIVPMAHMISGFEDPSGAALDVLRLHAALRPDAVEAWGILCQGLARAALVEWDKGHLQMARCLFEEAFQRYGRTLELETDPSRTLASWASDLGSYASSLWDAGKHEAATARYDEAFEHYEKALQITPDKEVPLASSGVDLANFAHRLWDAGEHKAASTRYEQAFQRYETAVQIDPNMHSALSAWGSSLGKFAQDLWDAGNDEAGTARFEEAFQRYENALQIKPDKHVALGNWASDLGSYATCLWDAGNHEPATARYHEAFERYEKALQIKPDKHVALNNWGFDLGELAERLWGAGDHEKAKARFEQAFQRFEKALQIKPDKHVALGNWGNALSSLAERLWDVGDHEAAAARYEQAFQRYEKALEIKPDKNVALNNWGIGLVKLAKRLWDAGDQETATARFEEAFNRYERACQINSDNHQALNNWGFGLGSHAERLWDAGDHETATARFEEAFQRYEKALEIKPDRYQAFRDWGGCLMKLGRRRGDNRLFDEGRQKCLEAERIKPGGGAYNLACGEALSGNHDAALEWLEKAIRADRSDAVSARTDKDMESLWDHPRFRELTGQSSE